MIPQPAKAFAIETLVFAAITWVILLVRTREIIVEHHKDGRPIGQLVMGLPGAKWLGQGSSLYWIAGGAIAARSWP